MILSQQQLGFLYQSMGRILSCVAVLLSLLILSPTKTTDEPTCRISTRVSQLQVRIPIYVILGREPEHNPAWSVTVIKLHWTM